MSLALQVNNSFFPTGFSCTGFDGRISNVADKHPVQEEHNVNIYEHSSN